MTIQVKATEQYFPVVLFSTVYYAVQVAVGFESVDEILQCDHLIQMEVIE